MLRVHFNDRDLARVTVAGDPLWDTLLAVHQLGGRAPACFRPWRQGVARTGSLGALAPAVRLLRTLAPARAGYFPDFLTPAAGREGLSVGIDALRGTPLTTLSGELALAFSNRRPPAWVRDLARGDAQRLKELSTAISTVHRTLVEPHWSDAEFAVEADRALRARALRDGGVHGLLHSLRPVLRWNPPVLEMEYPESRDLYLNGRGLCLVPSRFCWGKPVALADPALAQVVVYPAQQTSSRPPAGALDPLSELVGRTRARVLAALDGGRTTGEAAQLLTLAASSVSEHVTALRAAGLVTSRRLEGRTFHVLTPLGSALLRARPGADARSSAPAASTRADAPRA